MRVKARRLIVAAANENGYGARTYTMKHLNECVAICRRRGLVSPDVLRAAGFNSRRFAS